MIIALILLAMLYLPKDDSVLIADFAQADRIKDCQIVNDGVMGGVSKSTFEYSSKGYAKFSGEVSTKNNGGFASVRLGMKSINVSDYECINLRVKGDGKRYQFRLKSKKDTYFSYIKHFETNKEWQNVKIDFNDLYPSFRGRKLDMENFSGDQITEIALLIANKKDEKFEIYIESISAE